MLMLVFLPWKQKEYLGGENRAPKLKSMKPGSDKGTTEQVVVKTFTAKKSPQELEAENEKLKAKVAELEAEIARLKSR